MGGGVADMLLTKNGVDIVGVAGRARKLALPCDYIKTRATEDVLIQAAEDVIKPGAADIVILCTDSFKRTHSPRLKFIMEQGYQRNHFC